MELTESLMAFLEEQEEKAFVPEMPQDQELTDEAIKERFKITSKDQANYYVRKFKELEIAEAEIRDTAERQIKRTRENIGLWEEQELKKLQYPKNFFANLLQEYAAEQLADATKKTLSLPNGKIGFKKQKDEYQYDEELLKSQLADSKYAKHQVEVKIDKNSLKKDISVVDGKAYLEGALIPGIHVIPRAEKFEVK